MGKNLDSLTDLAKELLENGSDIESVLTFLRQEGCYKIDSIKIVRRAAGLSLEEGKRIVHLSNTWKDVREQDDALHDSLERAVDTLSQERKEHGGESPD